MLAALGRAFEEEGLPFAIAGGMGVQALLANAGLEHLLRRTGDVDVLVNGEDARVVRALNHLSAAEPRLTVIQNPNAKNARVGPMDVDWINEPSRLRGMETQWAPSIEHARVVQVRGLSVPVQQPEVLIAAKLTGQKIRPQDELDIAGVLQSGISLDEARLKDLVSHSTHPDPFVVYLAIKATMTEDPAG